MKTKNIIELNGKRYDAATGTIVGVAESRSKPADQPAATKNIDGFFRSTRTVAAKTVPVAHKISVVAAPAPAPKSPRKPLVTRTVANHTKAHTPASATTLMRSAVRRPDASFKKQTTVAGSLQHKVPSLIVAKQSAARVNPSRLARAASIEHSPHISRHGSSAPQVPVTLAPLAVQPTPVKPAKETTGAPAPQPSNKPVDIFEHAMANASNFVDTQTQKLHFKKKVRRHVASMAAGTLALLVVAGFAAYQNTPGLQFKVASLQAGVATNMPNLQAAGFAYNGVKAGNGKLTVGFSGQGGKYQLTQQPTNLSSDDMIQNIGATDASGTPDYTTVQAGNTAVYRFSNTNATWISGGKWYTVTGTGALTDSQVKALVQNS